MFKNIILLSILSAVSALKLPAMVWDSRNIFFACEDPIIRVQMGDRINIFCPNQLINQYLSYVNHEIEAPVYEKLYHVNTEQEYNSCDATNGYAKLVCDGTKSENRVCKDAGSSCTAYRSELFQLRAAERQIDYRKGNTYYFIGTTSLSQQNFNNTKGGSCNTTSPDRFKLRFKIYVCTDEEVANGECEPCKTQACYYKDCMSTFTPWKPDTTKIYQDTTGSCFVKETRNCTHLVTKTVKTEIRDKKIVCPTSTCFNWTKTSDEISIKASGNCEATEARICTNNINGMSYTEKREIITQCPAEHRPVCGNWLIVKTYQVTNSSCFILRQKTCTFQNISYIKYNETKIDCAKEPSPPPITAEASTIEKEVDKQYLYIGIGATIGAFIIGIILGIFCLKHDKNKKTIKAGVVAAQDEEALGQKGFANKGFSPQIAEREAMHTFHFGDSVFAPAGRIERVHPSSISTSSGLGRSVSFHYGDENVFSGPDVVPYRTNRTRRPGKATVNRHSSAASTTQLMRQFSNVSDYRSARLPSNELSRQPSNLSGTHVVIEEV